MCSELGTLSVLCVWEEPGWTWGRGMWCNMGVWRVALLEKEGKTWKSRSSPSCLLCSWREKTPLKTGKTLKATCSGQQVWSFEELTSAWRSSGLRTCLRVSGVSPLGGGPAKALARLLGGWCWARLWWAPWWAQLSGRGKGFPSAVSVFPWSGFLFEDSFIQDKYWLILPSLFCQADAQTLSNLAPTLCCKFGSRLHWAIFQQSEWMESSRCRWS